MLGRHVALRGAMESRLAVAPWLRVYRSLSNNDRGSKGVVVMEPPVLRALRDTAREPTPDSILVFPLWGKPLFPGTLSSTIVQDEAFGSMLKDMVDNGKRSVGLFLTRKEPEAPATNVPPITQLADVHPIGLLGSVVDIITVGQSKMAQVVLSGIRRIVATGTVPDTPRLTVTVEDLKEEPYDKNDQTIRAYCQEIIKTLRDLVRLEPFHREQIHMLSEQVDFNNPAELADLVAALVSTRDGAQAILEELDVSRRLRLALEQLNTELETNKIRSKLAKEVEKNFAETQRKYFLKEQLNIIQKELGITVDERGALVDKFKARLAKLVVPAGAKKVMDDELAKLSTLEPSGSEYNVTRTYLEWLTQLPWGLYNTENLKLDHAKRVLDEDHYGLKELKERILEFIAVGNLTGGVSGKIILLVGPPGVGKTSVGKSIARALDREFFRFSVGGMSDVSEIKGHRRTYVGAMPGKLIQALKLLKSSNPVVLIDEIDKLGRGYQGDPASALLEVLDPAQNTGFLDHYLDVPFDLSKVLFVCTANVLESVPGPLLDRMEVMRLSGYILEEKLEIASRYLLPKSQKESGVDPAKISVSAGALQALIADYAREAGVRNLEKQIEKIYRKAAFKLVSEEAARVDVTERNLSDFVGQPVFRSDRYYETASLPLGVVTGLAWTSMGGATLYIETVVDRVGSLIATAGAATATASAGTATLKTTGKMGDVMKESTEIALTYSKKFLERLSPGNAFFSGAALHMHIPEGATPKDGPSAGVTMVTSLLSLALNQEIPSDLAMTGELTLTGKVLPIGGVKEKVIAAKRSKVKRVLLPYDNERDWTELEAAIKEGVEVAFCKTYADVWAAVTGTPVLAAPTSAAALDAANYKPAEQLPQTDVAAAHPTVESAPMLAKGRRGRKPTKAPQMHD